MSRARFENGVAIYPDDMNEGYELRILLDDQGDVYVSMLPAGHRMGPSVRLCASGGADHVRGLLAALRAAYRAIKRDVVAAPAAAASGGAPASDRSLGHHLPFISVVDFLRVARAMQMAENMEEERARIREEERRQIVAQVQAAERGKVPPPTPTEYEPRFDDLNNGRLLEVE